MNKSLHQKDLGGCFTRIGFDKISNFMARGRPNVDIERERKRAQRENASIDG